MKFLADENIPRVVVSWLRDGGEDVDSIAESRPGIPDAEVLQWAIRTGRILVTADKDFGELVVRQHQDCPGLILIRLATGSPREFLEGLQAKWPQITAVCGGHLVIVERSQLRLRALVRPPGL